MNRKVILGNKWLTENGVRTYHDLRCLRVNGTFVQLQMDIHVTSILRAKKNCNETPNNNYMSVYSKINA